MRNNRPINSETFEILLIISPDKKNLICKGLGGSAEGIAL